MYFFLLFGKKGSDWSCCWILVDYEVNQLSKEINAVQKNIGMKKKVWILGQLCYLVTHEHVVLIEMKYRRKKMQMNL